MATDELMPTGGLRALFVTNECAGLGHLRRTINLARAITEHDPDATALIVTGSAALGSFDLPERVDTVKLPVFRREPDGTLYAATLGVDMQMIAAERVGAVRLVRRIAEPPVMPRRALMIEHELLVQLAGWHAVIVE